MSPFQRTVRIILQAALCGAFLLPARSLTAQEHVHTPGMTHPGAPGAVMPVQAGQSAFAALAEIVQILQADPKTDWSKVDIERLRQHLIDMDLVTLRSRVVATSVPGGAQFEVRGTADVVGAIKRMTMAHSAMMTATDGPAVTRTELPDGVRLVVTARAADDATAVARIRGLGFIGFLASGDHHAAHHLGLARGDAMAGHGH